MTDSSTELFTPDRAFQVAWIVYINGIEVPCASATVSYGVWQTPQAEVVLVPDPVIQRLGAEDRVSVQIFYCDYWIDPENPEFRLMFDGEIVSWSYVNVSTGRAISFTCVDYIHIWDQLFFFFMTSLDSMATAASGSTIGVNATSVLNAAFAPIYPYSLLANGLIPIPPAGEASGASSGAQLITRPIDFVYNVVRGLIDTSLPNRTAIGSNFFSPWTQRTNFHKRFAALPFLEDSANPGVFPILRAAQADTAVNAVARMASQVGNAGSVWQMLRDVLQPLMMEISMLPTPPAFRSDYATLKINGPAPSETTATSPIFLANYFTKPSFYFGLPPSCNVFFPSQISTFGYQEDFLTQPTRMYFNDETIPTLLERNATGGSSALSQILRDAISVAHPLEVNLAARAALNAEGITGKDILVYPEEFFKGPVIDRRPFPSWFVYIAGSGVQDTPEPSPTPTVDGVPVNVAPPSPGGPGATPAIPATPAPAAVSATPDAPPNASDGSDLFTPADGEPLSSATAPTAPIASLTAGAGAPAMTPAGAIESVDPSAAAAPVSSDAAPPVSTTFSSTGYTPNYTAAAADPADVALANEVGIPVFVLEAIRAIESGGNPRSLAFNRHIFRRDSSGLDIPENLYINGRVGRRDAFNAAFALNATAAVNATALGLWQVLGGLMLREYGNNPAALVQAFDTDPVAYSARSVVRWFNTGGVNSRQGKEAANNGNYALLAQRYFGSPNPGYTTRLANFVAARQRGLSVAEAAASIGRPMRGARSRSAPGTIVEPGGANPSSTATSEELNTELLRYYAQYEFYKERYSRRTGSLTMAFNPYPVPGFPCAVFDRRSTQVDVFGYLMNVNHILQATGWETRLGFTQGRTFQEMFSLLRQQFIFENAQLAETVNAADVEAATSTGFVGALGIAPPEPLREIRDVIQAFSRAETFYRTLFFCAPVPAIDTSPTATEAAPASSETAAPDGEAAGTPPVSPTGSTTSTTPVSSDTEVLRKLALAEKTATFFYTELIEYYDPTSDVRTPIQVSGVDSTTRSRALQALERLRTKSSPETAELDIIFVSRVAVTGADNNEVAVAQTELLLTQGYEASTPTQVDSNFELVLNDLRFAIQNLPVDFTIRGDLDIVPTAQALPLFQSYEQATRYNARPVCSLEEYIAFMGDRGVRISPIEPNSEADGARLFPAKYYVQIRQYRDGPPPTVPTVNITNTDFITAPSGTDAVTSGSGGPVVQGLPPDFPETRANWTDILLQYRQRTLAEQSPRS